MLRGLVTGFDPWRLRLCGEACLQRRVRRTTYTKLKRQLELIASITQSEMGATTRPIGKYVPIRNAWTSVNSACSSLWMDGQTEHQTLRERGEPRSPEAMVNVTPLESGEVRTSNATEDQDLNFRPLKTERLSLSEPAAEEQGGPEPKTYRVDQLFVQSSDLSLALAPKLDHSSWQRIPLTEAISRVKKNDFLE
uniref:Uncharacterized protein n=1 Tax=Rhodosorus marinus TaxID=101924 RepID=A0A7S2ZEW9_9RHOD|mmetsp:Transcript_16736/g.68523  ORF Transcript_16736/g.68523 Transcript_16736/m.68523 type:complete len:194 (+) Transcript_16736:140-721(+)